jgi:hypothetical protein
MDRTYPIIIVNIVTINHTNTLPAPNKEIKRNNAGHQAIADTYIKFLLVKPIVTGHIVRFKNGGSSLKRYTFIDIIVCL